MMVLVDKNRYRDFIDGEPHTVGCLRHARQIYIPFATLAELRAGFACGTNSRRNEAILTRFLNSPRVSVLYPDEATTHYYGRLFFQLRKQGTPIPVNDVWIAALAVQHDLLVLTRDRHFEHLPQIARA